jgi:hypothetical protein
VRWTIYSKDEPDAHLALGNRMFARAPHPDPLPMRTVWTGDMGNRCSETWVTLFGQTAHFFERSVTGALEGGIGHVSSP